MIIVQVCLCPGGPVVERGCNMENATALTGTGAKPVVPEPAFFALLLQELGFSGAENLETFCLKTLCPGETLPTVPRHGSLFFSAGMLLDAGYSLVPAGASASPDAGYSLVPAGTPLDIGHPLVSAGIPPDAELPLPPAAGKQPFLPAATSNCESELQQKISLPLENSGTTTPDLKTPGSDHSGTSRLLHGESGKPPLGELTDFFLRHGEKKQIPSGQIPSGQAVPERVVPA
ncbi:MAG TPA: hypothetical protein DCQ14_03490, partial [Firmicutes bacterium]|nr:hypothetical protein [Bacillota bacterium]